MRRLASTAWLDVRLQARAGLYAIGLSLAVVMGLAGRFLVPPEAMSRVLPVLFLLLLGSSTYIFGAGMVLLERGQGTLGALRVTPVRAREYIGSKVATLSVFAFVEGVVVLLVAVGPDGFRPALLIPGALAMAVMYTLFGLIQVAPHESVTDFLVPGAIIATLVLQLPLFPFLGLWPSPLWYAIPTFAPLTLLEGSLRPIGTGEWVYAIAYGSLTLVVCWRLVRARFARHMGLGDG